MICRPTIALKTDLVYYSRSVKPLPAQSGNFGLQTDINRVLLPSQNFVLRINGNRAVIGNRLEDMQLKMRHY